jgi:hypothetical protein
MILTIIFALPLFFMWLFSYSGNLGVLDAFYIWSYVNSWYYITGFWLLQIFWFVVVSKRNSDGTLTPDTYEDHSMNISIVQMLFGFFAIIFQTVWADRFNFWYVKQQFMNGRSVNDAKNNVWTYPASIGSTGRSNYELTLAAPEDRREINADRVEDAANNERRVA